MSKELFPTTVIGSFPRPAWLRDVILDREAGNLSHSEASRILDRALDSIILMQEQAGLDEITDGEWRREDYVTIFAKNVKGFRPGLRPWMKHPYPAVVAPLECDQPLVADEVRFTRSRTQKRIKMTLPAPYILGRRMWSEEHSAGVYPRREAFMEACVPILRKEIEILREAGVDTVQLDEPQLSTLVDPKRRERENITDVRYEIDLCVDMLNQVLDGVDGIQTGVHLCHAHSGRKHGSFGRYDIIMPALGKIKVDIISMEYASPASEGLDSLRQFPKHTRLGLGCIDHCNPNVETPEEVITQVETAMKYVDKERIVLHPDCGFSPSVYHPMDLDEAFAKIKAMCQAAEQLRARFS